MRSKSISRNTFVKRVLTAGAFAMLNPLNNSLLASPGNTRKFLFKDDILDRLVIANDIQVDKLLHSDLDKPAFSRKIGYDFAALSASYSSQHSKFHHSPSIVSALEN